MIQNICIAITCLPVALVATVFIGIGAFLTGIGKQLMDSAEALADGWKRWIP